MDIGGLVSLFGPLLAAGGGASGIRFVGEGERGLKLRFRKAVKRRGEYRVVHPGLIIMIPTVHKLARTHVRQRTINFPSQTIILKDRTVFEVGGVLICNVKDTPDDLYRALFETTDLNTALTDYGTLMIRDVLANKNHDALFGDGRGEISRELIEKIKPKAAEWGVEVTTFELSDCDPAHETGRMIQTAAQANFRLQALEEAAKKLEIPVSSLPAGLAAVLVGAPLVASATVETLTEVSTDSQERHEYED